MLSSLLSLVKQIKFHFIITAKPAKQIKFHIIVTVTSVLRDHILFANQIWFIKTSGLLIDVYST